jgi:DNA-binding MurR/RpiR family transcriptional regulator
MNDTSVPILEIDSTGTILARLTAEWDELTPEAQKAARYVLDNPQDVGVSTVREIAEAANVKPNTVVRMTRQAGFEGYEDFRAPFRDAIRSGTVDLGDRARWLQDIAKSGDLGGLYADMVGAALKNVQDSFANLSVDKLEAAANAIWQSRNVYTMGVGVNHTNAQNFTYLASTGMVGFHAIPGPGLTAVDDIAWADEQDVLIAMTMRPYRREVIEAVNIAIAQGMCVIAISDSPASPIIRAAQHGFIVSVETPQFFPSSVGTLAVLETLLSFVISVASEEIVDRVETFHQRRTNHGFYEEDPS